MSNNKKQMVKISQWLNKLSPSEERRVILNLIERLIEIGEVRYREAQSDLDLEEDVFWDSDGESIKE